MVSYILKKTETTIGTVQVSGKRFSKKTDKLAFEQTPVDRLDAIFTVVRMDNKFYAKCRV